MKLELEPVGVVRNGVMGSRDEEWGRVVAPGDPVALADALHELLSRPASERAAMGAAARAWVVEERDSDRWAARLVALLNDAGVA